VTFVSVLVHDTLLINRKLSRMWYKNNYLFIYSLFHGAVNGSDYIVESNKIRINYQLDVIQYLFT